MPNMRSGKFRVIKNRKAMPIEMRKKKEMIVENVVSLSVRQLCDVIFTDNAVHCPT